MGMISTLLKLSRGKLATRGNAPGKSVVMQAEGVEGQTMDAEVFQTPGVLAIPGDGSRGVWLPVGGSNRYGVVIAMHNYALNITLEAGETAIYSTNAAGAQQAIIKLRADGSIELNGSSKKLVTHAELNTALQGLVTTLNTQLGTIAAGASAAISASGLWLTPLTIGGLSLDISASETTTIKTGG